MIHGSSGPQSYRGFDCLLHVRVNIIDKHRKHRAKVIMCLSNTRLVSRLVDLHEPPLLRTDRAQYLTDLVSVPSKHNYAD